MTLGQIKQALKLQTHFTINYDFSVTKHWTSTIGANTLQLKSDLSSYETNLMQCTEFDNKYAPVWPSTWRKKNIRSIFIVTMKISYTLSVVENVWWNMTTSYFQCKSLEFTLVTKIKMTVISRIRLTGIITHREVSRSVRVMSIAKLCSILVLLRFQFTCHPTNVVVIWPIEFCALFSLLFYKDAPGLQR